MAVYKIFAEKDATLYSYDYRKNTGLDEILEVSTYQNIWDGRGETSRAVIAFNTQEIKDVVALISSAYSASLKLYLAAAEEIPLDYTLYCYPLSETWDMGTGRESSIPSSSNGVSWKYRKNFVTQDQWTNSSFGTGITGSFPIYSFGGGVWYNGIYESSQSFSYVSKKDINFDVTTAIHDITSSIIINEGFIIKHAEAVEFNYSASAVFKYFSSDTHTIYPPVLEIRWDDSSFITGSGSVITNSSTIVNVPSKYTYTENSIIKFRVNARDQFPVRTFSTSSLYTQNKLLPETSYWAIKDMNTEEYIIDFDESATKISADGLSSYFTLYMNGLQPERFYKILIKSIIGSETIIFDENSIFKVIR